MVNNNYLNRAGGRIFKAVALTGISAVCLMLSSESAVAQTVGITDGPNITPPNSKALLDIRLDENASVGKGVLIPRVTHAQRLAMSLNNDFDNETESGMLVYQYESGTSPKGFYSWNGIAWTRLLDASSGGWSTVGNSGTVAGTNFLGTTDDVGLRIRTNNLDRIRISAGDASGGNVGIGVSSAALERLEVNGNLIMSQGADRRLYVGRTTTNTAGYGLVVEAGSAPNPNASAQPGGHLVLQAGAGYSHTNPGAGGNVVLRSGGNSYNDSPTLSDQWGEILFETGNNGSLTPTQRMRITKLGKVIINDLAGGNSKVLLADGSGQLNGLNVPSTNQVLKANGSGGVTWGQADIQSGTANGQILWWNHTSQQWVFQNVPTTAQWTALNAVNPGAYFALTVPGDGQPPAWQPTTAFTVQGDDMGDHTATQTLDMAGNRIEKVSEVVCGSDIRYKKDIEPIKDALSSVLKMNGVTYDWRKDEFPSMGFGTNRQVGLIAQELEQVFPIVVSTDENGFKAVNYAHMVALLIEAIKDQQALIDGQRTEITSLKSMKDEMDALKASVELLNEHLRTTQK